MDCNGNLFFVLMNPLALVCWDTSTPYCPQNIRVVIQNDLTLQFASGLKIIKNLSGVEEIFIMTNRFQVSNAKFIEENILQLLISCRKSQTTT